MGLFDKLKKNNIKEAKVEEVCETLNENFDDLTDLQVLEKINQYNNEFESNMNEINFKRLKNAFDEFSKRMKNIPLSKKGAISQDLSVLTSCVYQLSTNIPYFGLGNVSDISKITTGVISSSVAKIYTELSK